MSADRPIQAQQPIGVFDSGVGGLSILREIRARLPNESLIYLADQAHVPYGPRRQQEIRQFSEAITRHLLNLGAKLIVVACNTASAAALTSLRQTFPGTPFVGMEPAVKPAAHQTKSGHVGVLATAGTFASQRYAELMARYANGVTVSEDPCVGLVDLIEGGQIDGPVTEARLSSIVQPMLASGVDTLVLGCTHYPFIIPTLTRLVGPAVSIIDPAPAIARQVEWVLAQRGWLRQGDPPPPPRYLTTGDAAAFARQISHLLGEVGETAVVRIPYSV